MPFQPVEETIEVKLFYRYEGQEKFYNVGYYLKKTGGWTSGNIDTVLAATDDAWEDELATPGYYGLDAELFKITVRDLSVEFGYSATADVDIDGTGDATPWLPPNSAILVTFRGGSSGPPREGGLYWPFVSESWAGPTGVLSGAALDVGDAVAAAIAASRGGLGGNHVILSRFSKNDAPIQTPPYYRDPVIAKTVTTYGVRAVVASQRDRRPTS